MSETPSDAPAPEVSVLVISYNTEDWIGSCLRALQTSSADLALETIVVDNASTDGSADLLRGQHPEVRTIALDQNIGFGRACNLAAAEARGSFLFLLNPDTELQPGALRALIEFARANPRHGIYGARVLDAEGRPLASACWGYPTLWSLACWAVGLSTLLPRNRWFDPESLGPWERDTLREVDVVTGCSALVPREVWDTLGGFDPRYFLYGEDADLCLRAWKAGWRPVMFPGAEVVHHVGVASASHGHKMARVLQGKLTFLRLHRAAWAFPLAQGLYLAGTALRALLGSATWRHVWAARREWRRGYPDSA